MITIEEYFVISTLSKPSVELQALNLTATICKIWSLCGSLGNETVKKSRCWILLD